VRSRATLVALACATFGAGCGDDFLMDGGSSSAMKLAAETPKNIVVAATGLETQPAQLSFRVPVASAADIVSATFYWVGRGAGPTGDDRILVSGSWKTGTLLASYEVGGDLPWVFFYAYDALGQVRPGNNNYYVSNFQPGSPSRADGIAAVVIYNDALSPWTAIHTVVPTEFVSAGTGSVLELPIGGCAAARNARFLMLAGDCTADGSDRVWWSAPSGPLPASLAGGGANALDDLLGAGRGNWMDVLDASLEIPAYATHFAYQVESPAIAGDDILHLLGAICIDGEATSCTGAIAGTVWQDDDRDGVPAAGEPGLAGVPVRLTDAAGNVVADTVTDAAGAYSFPLRCAGDYRVAVDETALPAGYESTTCGLGACNPCPVTLAADDEQADVDLGWAPPAPTASTRCFLSLGFWKQQFQHPAARTGGLLLDEDTLAGLVDDVAAMTGLDWTGGDGVLSAEDVHRVLRWGPQTGIDWTERYYLVSLLNWALNGAVPNLMVDTTDDGTMDLEFQAYVAEVEALLATGDATDLHHARAMVISVNRMPDEGCDVLFPGQDPDDDSGNGEDL